MNSKKERTRTKQPEQRIRQLEAELKQNAIRNANNLVDLIAILNEHGPATSKAIHATRRALLLLDKNFTKENLRKWQAARTRDYATALLSVLANPKLVAHHDAAVASAALVSDSVFRTLIISTLKEPIYVDNAEKDDNDDDGDEHDQEEKSKAETPILSNAVSLIHTSVSRFSDLSHIAFLTLADENDSNNEKEGNKTFTAASKSQHEKQQQQPFHLRLSLLYAASEAPVSAEKFAARSIPLSALRKCRTEAWISILRDPRQTLDTRRDLVARIPTKLLPFMHNPLVLADFLTACYDASSSSIDNIPLSLASLHALFILISQHGLDYPHFFHKLYALFSNSAFAICDNQFRKLAAAFLTKGGTRMLPRNIASAFIKRLVRRAITCSTANALWALRLAINLIQTYPATTYLVHSPPVNLFDSERGKKRPRSDSDSDSQHQLHVDSFDDTQNDPELSQVEHSSLWELDVLARHHSPAVSRLVLLFATDMRQKPPPLPGTLEDYSNLTFSDLLQAEVKRRVKSLHVAYDVPGTSTAHVQLDKQISSSIAWS